MSKVDGSTVSVIGAIVLTAVISATAGVWSQGAKTEEGIKATDIAQIDVMREQISQLTTEVEKINSSTISRSELESTIENINETIIRRFGEDVATPIDQVRKDAEKNEDAIIELRAAVAELQALVSVLEEIGKLKGQIQALQNQ